MAATVAGMARSHRFLEAESVALYWGRLFMGAPVLESELAALEERIQRLLAAYQQARLERRRALQERDRLLTLNTELRKRIEGVITRIKTMEQTEQAE
jgi:hypothetical protein